MTLYLDNSLRKVNSYLKRGSIVEAENALKVLLTKYPKNLRAIQLNQNIRQLKNTIQINNKNNIIKNPLSKDIIRNLVSVFKSEDYKNLLNTISTIIEKNSEEYILWYLKGLSLAKLENFKDAISNLKMASQLNPQNHEIYNHIGMCYKLIKDFGSSQKYFELGLGVKKHDFNLMNNLANVLKDKEEYSQALKLYHKCIELNTDNQWGIYYNIGLVHLNQNNLDKAIENYQMSIEKNPNHANTYNDLGNVYQKLGKSRIAQNFYKQAISLKNNHVDAHHNLGDSQRLSNKLEEALNSYNKAFLLNPNNDYLLGSLTFIKMKLCLWDDLEISKSKLIKNINDGKIVSTPFPIQALIDDPNIQKKTNEIFSKKNYLRSNIFSPIKHYSNHKKIKVGYFSPDFCNHPISFLTAELYETHDREKFEIYAFSFGYDTKDEFNLRIMSGVDKYYNVKKMSDKEVVELARLCEIDIAIDLTGYTKGHRSNIFAMSAAPIQIAYAGYLGTMGNDFHDYLISDKTMIPESNKKFFSEKIIYLPNYQVNLSYKPVKSKCLNRNTFGLPNEVFVFGCFNNSYKISSEIFDSWSKLLKNVENSVLILIENNETTKNNLVKEIEKRGVNSKRLIFGNFLPRQEYLLRYQAVDLFLDTFPYNGGTTTSDALRMGLPVLTCKGHSFPSRLASSILNAIGLQELISHSQDEYVKLAIELALNKNKLRKIKSKLVKNSSNSKLYNIKAFTDSIEKAYIEIYNKNKNEIKPDHIYIK